MPAGMNSARSGDTQLGATNAVTVDGAAKITSQASCCRSGGRARTSRTTVSAQITAADARSRGRGRTNQKTVSHRSGTEIGGDTGTTSWYAATYNGTVTASRTEAVNEPWTAAR